MHDCADDISRGALLIQYDTSQAVFSTVRHFLNAVKSLLFNLALAVAIVSSLLHAPASITQSCTPL